MKKADRLKNLSAFPSDILLSESSNRSSKGKYQFSYTILTYEKPNWFGFYGKFYNLFFYSLIIPIPFSSVSISSIPLARVTKLPSLSMKKVEGNPVT